MAEYERSQIYKKRYEVVKKFSSGKFGSTYLVTDNKATDESKVLKVFRFGEVDSEQTVDCVREAETLSILDNEHIVKFYESFLGKDCLCVVSEFCDGGDLDQYLKELKKQNRILEEDQVVEWLQQILIAIRYMHKSRLLHKNIKARNIFLKSNKIKIGLSDLTSTLGRSMDVAALFTGSTYYMPPEVMKSDGYEAKSDIWAVGCVLYEMCALQRAFDGKDVVIVMYKVIEGKPPYLPKTYSKELNEILNKMLIKEPKNRPTAAHLLESSYIKVHRDRTNVTDSLGNTISGNQRSKELAAFFHIPKNFERLQKQSWAVSNKDTVSDEDDDDQPGNVSSNQLNEKQQTVKSPRQPTTERKSHENLSNEQIQSDTTVTTQNPQMLENTNLGTMEQSKSSAGDMKEEEPSNDRARNPIEHSKEVKANNNAGAVNASSHENIDDCLLTPLRKSLKHIAKRFTDEDNVKCNGNQSDDRSPTRKRESNEMTLKNRRAMSASQCSTMNPLSRSIDSRNAAGVHQEQKSMSPLRINGRSKPQNALSNVPSNDDSSTLKDKRNRDASDPVAKDLKIKTLRTKAIQCLGESTFEKVYNYLVKQRTAQRTDPSIDEAKISRGLTVLIKNPVNCFLVDQIVCLELLSE